MCLTEYQKRYKIPVLKIEGLKCFDVKKSKNRMSYYVVTKMVLKNKSCWSLENQHHPRCLAGINKNNLGVIYKNNNQAGMTSNIFEDWLQTINKMYRNMYVITDNILF